MKKGTRGMAMIVVLSIVVVLTVIVGTAITLSGQDQRNTGKVVHNTSLQDTTESALQFARFFFTQNYSAWNTYLAYFTTARTLAQVQVAHPELMAPQPTGSNYSCFIYAKDDVDELPPAVNNPSVDNNLRIFVGAVCTQTSSQNGTPLQSELVAPLEYNPSASACQSQFSGGTQGVNNCSMASGYR
jgi:hypothetical protein